MSPRHRADVDVNLLEQIELGARHQQREQALKPSRKELKLAEKKAIQEKNIQIVLDAEAAVLAQRSIIKSQRFTPNQAKNRKLKRSLTMLTSVGIFGTVALPAYAFSPQEAAMAQFATTNANAIATDADTQGLTTAQVKSVVISRLQIKQTTKTAFDRSLVLNKYSAYNGPSAQDYVNNPPYSKLDGAAILAVARKYVGVPYVFGGENPAGFDCSGYVRFVFAQFGVDLPHAVHLQAKAGIIIRKEDAMPGDIVVLNDLSHDGIYAGAGMFYHAPRPGDTIKLAPIFTNNYFIVRLNTK